MPVGGEGGSVHVLLPYRTKEERIIILIIIIITVFEYVTGLVKGKY